MEEKYLSISAFSKISDVSRKALIYYDRIGLFKPEYVKENGYRYYSHHQIETITVINTLSSSGMSLEQIKEFLKECEPQKALDTFKKQELVIQDKIKQLQAIQEMIDMRIQLIDEALNADEIIKIEKTKEKPFYISPPFYYHTKYIPEDIWIDFYNTCENLNISFGYPICYIINKDDVCSHNYQMISQIGIHLKNSKKANYKIPAATYLIGYGYAHYGDTEHIYEKLYQYIDENHLEVIGNAYEEYLLDEVTTSQLDRYKIKVSIQIKES